MKWSLVLKPYKLVTQSIQICKSAVCLPSAPFILHPLSQKTSSLPNSRLYFDDVQVNGEYPRWLTQYFKNKNYNLDITDKDLEILKHGTVNYIAFSYYMSFAVKYTDHMDYREYSDLVENPFVKASDWGWPVDPVGLRYALNWMTTRWHKPLFIVENSLGAYDKLTDDHKVHDDYRIEYLRSHINEMKKAVTEDGVDLWGDLPWGCIDLVSASTGEMNKR